MRGRLHLILAVVIILGLAISACAPAQGTSVPREATPAGEKPASQGATQTVAAPATSVPTTKPTEMTCQPADYKGPQATVKFVWWVGGGDSPSDRWFRDAVECFNARYAGKIKVIVEYVPGQHDYVSKLKTEYAASGTLPPIVTLKRDPTLAKLWIEKDELVDLKPYFEASPDWQAISLKDSVDLNTVNGKLIAAPDTFVTAIGYFYNKELFAKAGIKQTPQTWDEFFAALEQLKAAGIPALALHTDDTGWSPMLLFEALLARTQEGRDFLNQRFPDNFGYPYMVEAAKDLAKLFQYTTPDALGAKYPIAANNFLNGKAAIMPNGPWMIADFRDPSKSSAGFGDKVGVALYPGNVAIDDTGRQLGDWAVTKNHPPEVVQAAVEFIKWMNSAEVVRQRVIRLGSTAPNLKLPKEDLAQIDPLAAQLIEQVQEKKAPVLPNYQGQWNTLIQNETLVQNLPQLALGKMTPEQFVEALTKAAKEGDK